MNILIRAISYYWNTRYVFRNYKGIDKVFYEYLDNMILNKMFTMIDIVVIPKFVSYHK